MMTAANANKASSHDNLPSRVAVEAHDCLTQAANKAERALTLANSAGWSDKKQQRVAQALSLLRLPDE